MTNVRDLDIKPDKKRVKHIDRSMAKRNHGKQLEPVVLGYVERFQKFKPGQSFFIEGIKPKDIEFLRRPIQRAGMGVVIRMMKNDPIYKKAGVRIWRQSGPYDDL